MGRTVTRLKVCCIQSISEARLAMRHGASALGLVSAMPSGPGPISEESIAEIAAQTPPGIATFLLTCETRADAIVAQHRRCRTTTLQLVDRVEPGAHAALREALPGIGIVQVIHIESMESFEEAVALAPEVDVLLLDSGRPSATVKELGGTGRVHDWSISRRLVQAVDKPVYLAGGLNPENVAEAVRQVRPFAVDVCSGLRTDGALDEAKLVDFTRALAQA
jgi:phosphoribosylanthranilate isomerase